MVVFFFTEPTNNVSPKKIGAEFGFRVAYLLVGKDAYLICQVSGFPVPRFL